jgi:putative ABC transport system permease protein
MPRPSQIREILVTALGEIRHHAMRSALTLLGIVLGTLSIVVMTSLLDGVTSAVWEGMDDLGYDGVMLVVGREARDHRESLRFARSRGLRPRDAGLLAGRGGAIAGVAPVALHEALVRGGGVERTARLYGVTPSYAAVRNRGVAAGRFLGSFDERSSARVCVLGHRLAAYLYGTEDPVGRVVRVGSQPFRVIGVGRRLGNRFVDTGEFIEEMEGLAMPLATLRAYFTGDTPLSMLAVRGGDAGDLDALRASIGTALRRAHHGAADFRIENVAEEMLRGRKEAAAQIRAWTIVLSAIASVSLLVGGIGLLSVMLIAIGERFYEIGLRKALGATEPEIFLQFLGESAVLATLGGLLGAGLGAAVTTWCARFFPQGLPLDGGGLLLAVGIALLLGILYGIYPALRAARLAPVDALRAGA